MDDKERSCDQENREQDNYDLPNALGVRLRSRLEHPVIVTRQIRRKFFVFEGI